MPEPVHYFQARLKGKTHKERNKEKLCIIRLASEEGPSPAVMAGILINEALKARKAKGK